MAIKVILTDAGIQALINKQKDGTNALVLSSVQFGTGKYTASEDQTALREPFKTLNTIKGGNIGDNLIHVGIRDTDYEKYEVYEIGVFTADGILFAVYAQDTPIMQKAAPTHALFTFEFPLLTTLLLKAKADFGTLQQQQKLRALLSLPRGKKQLTVSITAELSPQTD